MSEPNCQCPLWETMPGLLRSQGIPRGFCGHCEVCGRPGHTRHFPGVSPSSGTWCERHYQRLRWLHPMGVRGRFVYPAAIVGLLVLITLWRL